MTQSSFFSIATPFLDGRRIVAAILLKDMQSRFVRGYLSYLVSVAWPLMHVIGLSGFYILTTRLAPVGDDPVLFAMTGIVPYILCLYPGRSMPVLFILNKQLLFIPAIRPMHIIVAGFTIEILTACIVLLLLVGVLYIAGVDVFPISTSTMATALAATLFLAAGLGAVNILLTALFGQFYIVFYILFMVLLYVTSATYIPVWAIPHNILTYVQYNPLFNLVSWMRSAYYVSYDDTLINKSIVLLVAGCSLFVGLLGERYMRNKFYG